MRNPNESALIAAGAALGMIIFCGLWVGEKIILGQELAILKDRGNLAEWMGVLASTAVAILALFGKQIRELFWHPKGRCELGFEAPLQGLGHNSYYFHLRVSNTGNEAATAPRCFVSRVRRMENETFAAFNSFAMPLTWLDSDDTELKHLLPGEYKVSVPNGTKLRTPLVALCAYNCTTGNAVQDPDVCSDGKVGGRQQCEFGSWKGHARGG